MNTIKVRTTQNVEVEYAIASVGDRILAYLVDGAVYVGAMIILGMVIGLLRPSGGGGLWGVLLVLPFLFYHLLFEIFLSGQSLGKRAMDIKVIKLSGQAPSVGDYLLRWVFRLLDITLSSGFVALITLVVNGRGQRLGDLAAGTSVIKTQVYHRRNPFQVKLEEEYAIVFPEVAALTDQDMALIRKLLHKAIQNQNETLLSRISERVQEVLEIRPEMTDRDFLKTVIKDYYHLTAGVEA
ncbi:RDD family protein [Rufibacter ruber]|uniref:RDD family protein n=1 Tax=Rufibacter ruber TaxID=1783499 RepID=UPI000832236C|nr:RDD family protein [Rufibacter ruber]